MTVFFTDKPDSVLPVKPDLNALLLPQLRSRHGDQDLDVTLLRVLCRGLSTPGVTAVAVQRWLLANASPELQAVVSNPNHFFRLCSLARKRVELVNGGGGAAEMRLQVARRGIRLAARSGGGQLSMGQEAKARVALAIIVSRQIESGWDKQRATALWLGTQMNLSSRAAALLLRGLEQELRWIRRVGGKGAGIDYRLTQIRGADAEELRDFTWLHAPTVDAWAAQDDSDRLAALLRTAAHPAWHYALDPDGRPLLGARAFVAAVHGLSGLPADEPALGLPVRALRRLGRDIEMHLPGAAASGNWAAALDDLALVTGAFELRAARDVKAAAETAANRIKVEQFRAEKALRLECTREVGKVFRAVFHFETGVLGPVPRDAAALTDWTSKAARHFNAGAGAADVGPDLVEAARDLLQRNVEAAGHPVEASTKVAAFVFREPVAVAA